MTGSNGRGQDAARKIVNSIKLGPTTSKQIRATESPTGSKLIKKKEKHKTKRRAGDGCIAGCAVQPLIAVVDDWHG